MRDSIYTPGRDFMNRYANITRPEITLTITYKDVESNENVRSVPELSLLALLQRKSEKVREENTHRESPAKS
jgi:hypothetical protein